jgi:hypothetical protein
MVPERDEGISRSGFFFQVRNMVNVPAGLEFTVPEFTEFTRGGLLRLFEEGAVLRRLRVTLFNFREVLPLLCWLFPQ